jgi:hypothetical protein
MQINPENREFSEPFDLKPDNLKEEIGKLLENENIVAIGSEQHLQALKQDLLKAGYKKRK